MSDDVAASLNGLAESTQSLQHTIADLTDQQAREDSLLPGWTRGHVLTHLARNADALINLCTWARTGVETPMYASREERNATIENQAGRPAAELVADVETSSGRFSDALAALSSDDWQTPIRWGARQRETPASEIPWLRRVEVEVHHVDLDLDHTIAHWPEDFVERLIAQAAADYTARDDVPGFVLVGNDGQGPWEVAGSGPEVGGSPASLLGWLIGRTDGIGLHSEGALPELGAWR